jgi:hypothetical protein
MSAAPSLLAQSQLVEASGIRAPSIWGSKHLPGERVFVHRHCEHPIEIAYRCAKCKVNLTLADIAFRTEETPGKRKSSKQ